MYRSTRSTKQSSKLKILPEEPEDSSTGGGASGGATPINASSPIIGSGGTLAGQSNALGNASSGYRRNPSYSEPPAPTASLVGHASANSPHHSVDDDESSSDDAEGEDEEAVEVYKQLAQIPEGSMRRDARRLTKRSRAKLPRVTAYSTATSYRMRELTKWLNARRSSHQTNVLTFDECLYTTYTYKHVDEARGLVPTNANGNGSSKHRSNHRDSTGPTKTGDLLGIPELNQDNQQQQHQQQQQDGTAQPNANPDTAAAAAAKRKRSRFSVEDVVPELFIMDYGTIVIWGMTLQEEKRFLRELRRFEVERLASEDVESEDLHWYLADYSRIYNDVITLRRGSSYMTKLSLSHALAQSTKISFFEGIIDNTIESTKDIPQSIAESGKIGMPPAEIMKQIGHLFILRMNIHLVGSIVDSPEIFWRQPDLEPLYSAARSYLEIPQRIDLLNTRVEVLQDMLQLLKDQVTSSHSEYLEIVVILLIMLEIVLGVATMLVDLYFG
ncbi:related to RMD1 - cytoplasmic protein required for sporulation [Ustilago trichophora]|uniref:Related to RMD1 - cytoplasmic protein required for sporulation n=1 Tax=Ustilago trichophora TaxID=86804 RepID=A0A5C3EBZ2_9BASI|nr:related to RMD1 - cytoplasmic protein required for sporulation [Ustilago trichophora]